MTICGGSIFGNSSQYIKIDKSDFVAVDGLNSLERLIGSDIRMPYKQILKSRITLKKGQVNYLLNHLGLGDNATFLAIKATYNKSSVNEEDNYVVYNYYDNLGYSLSFAQLLVLTGNSTNRIKQLYLTNPNTKYDVTLEVMVAIIDEDYSFYDDTINQIGISFTNLTINNIETHVAGESIVIWDNIPRNVLAYITIDNITSISRTGTLIIIDDTVLGRFFLDFETEYDAKQADSLINYVLDNQDIVIQDLDPLTDDLEPVVYFYSNVGNTSSGYTISVTGTTSIPTDTSMGTTFSTSITFGTVSSISKDDLIEYLIDSVNDNRDGTMSITSSSILLYDYNDVLVSDISTSSVTYSLKFSISDIAGNEVDTNINLNIYII